MQSKILWEFQKDGREKKIFIFYDYRVSIVCFIEIEILFFYKLN
jgi:hypothetical protein